MDARFYTQKSDAVTAAETALRAWGYPQPRENEHFELDNSDHGWFWYSWLPRLECAHSKSQLKRLAVQKNQ